MERVLVAGATGTTGKEIINLLKHSDRYSPIAMVRKSSQQDQFEKMGVATLQADLTEDISQVTQEADKVIFAAGSKGKNLKEVDQEGAKKLVDAAKANSVKKFVMLSAIGADRPEASEDLQEYLKAKQDADEYLQASKLNYTIVRPGALNNESASHRVKAAKQLEPEGEISRADVARTLVASLEETVAPKATFELLSGDEIIETALLKFS